MTCENGNHSVVGFFNIGSETDLLRKEALGTYTAPRRPYETTEGGRAGDRLRRGDTRGDSDERKTRCKKGKRDRKTDYKEIKKEAKVEYKSLCDSAAASYQLELEDAKQEYIRNAELSRECFLRAKLSAKERYQKALEQAKIEYEFTVDIAKDQYKNSKKLENPEALSRETIYSDTRVMLRDSDRHSTRLEYERIANTETEKRLKMAEELRKAVIESE